MKFSIADSRGRINLGKENAEQIFLVFEEDGKIILDKPALMVERGLSEARQGKLKKNAINLEK